MPRGLNRRSSKKTSRVWPDKLLDQIALDVDAGAIAPVLARLEAQRQLGELVDHVLQVALPQVHLAVFAGAAEAGRVAHDLAHGHRAGLVDRIAVLAPDLQAFELGDVLGEFVVQLAHLPSSHSIIIAAPVIGFDIEAMRKMESVASGVGSERSCLP